MNTDILGISELKWTGMGGFNSDDPCIYHCGQEPLRRKGVALMSTEQSEMRYLGAISKIRMISICFQGKPFSITVIQVYSPNTNGEEAEVEWFYEELQDLLELIPKKMSFSL